MFRRSLFAVLPWLYGALRLAGGVYLVYLGVRLWGDRDPGSDAVDASSRGPLREAWLRGLLTNLTNPKSAAYFGSVFALFMSPGTPGWVRAAAIAIVAGSAALWYGGLALAFSTDAAQRLYARARGVLNRLAGAAIAAFGLRLLLSRD